MLLELIDDMIDDMIGDSITLVLAQRLLEATHDAGPATHTDTDGPLTLSAYLVDITEEHVGTTIIVPQQQVPTTR